MLLASYFYVLCQALDLRALQRHYNVALSKLLTEEFTAHFSAHLPESLIPSLHSRVLPAILASLDSTTTMDAVPRLQTVAAASTGPILDFVTSIEVAPQVKGDMLGSIASFRASFSEHAAQILQDLRRSFVSGKPPARSKGTAFNPRAPAAAFLGRTRPMYEYIRIELGVRTHGQENWTEFEGGLGNFESQPGIGRNVSVIYEAIRDGKMQAVATKLFKN